MRYLLASALYPYSWQWSYTLLALVCVLAPFLVIGAVLLLRRSPRRWHRSPERSVSTPYGDIGYWDINTQHMLAQGLERAREREYHLKGRD